MLFHVLFSLISVTIVNSQRVPTIVNITPDQIKDIGGAVELSCSALYSQGYGVLWKKLEREGSQESILLSSDTTPIIRDSRYSLRYDSASTTYTLQIKDIQESDAGVYKCQILISQNSQVSREVRLQVFSPPTFYDNSSSTVVVSERNAVHLKCYAGGVPRPQISWKRENNAILPTGGPVYKGNVLKINNIRREDRGTYYCTADNKVGKNIKRSIAVEVEFAPIVHATKPMVWQALNYDAELECRVEAYPIPQITWIKDGIQLASNNHYKTNHFPSIDEFTDTMLRVVTTEKGQYGTYVCKAVNKLGDASAYIQFFESENPVCPPACGSAHIKTISSLIFIFCILIQRLPLLS
ncbi:lachesin-like [Planococcus citri]|uniref:lachesin-like n=1 Tax=Planococcus citri TaxID=170843 RepID=UPI0031F8FD97